MGSVLMYPVVVLTHLRSGSIDRLPNRTELADLLILTCIMACAVHPCSAYKIEKGSMRKILDILA